MSGEKGTTEARTEQAAVDKDSPAADQADVDRLSKWLDGEGEGSTLLTWLGEGGDVVPEDELTDLKERLARYEEEL
ncbi:MAG TPA: hypothetical protein PKJ15_07535, partial [Methanomassiliicoccales archaeon]|nr:hypothetical protein [Methanomassiliicoccales archaeon]